MNQNGFSLVEVLVAITLLAIGLLAVAGMQATAISGNSFAQTGTIATALADEMVDRIRTNAGQLPGIYNGINTTNSVSSLQASFDGAAESDAIAWKNRLESSVLRNAVGEVAIANGPIPNTSTITVRVRWRNTMGSGTDRQIVLSTILETWGT